MKFKEHFNILIIVKLKTEKMLVLCLMAIAVLIRIAGGLDEAQLFN